MTDSHPGQAWIERLQLARHPEGGYFRRIYTHSQAHPQADVGVGAAEHSPRPQVTSIHYLLTRDEPVGHLHRNRSTILHYLQDGGPVEYILLSEPGTCQRITLGFAPGDALFLAVPGGCWKASVLRGNATHALVSEAVVPGFDPADHEFMSLEQLQREYPEQQAVLRDLIAVHGG